MRTGTARLPLHSGKAPRWLTQRMAVLGREIILLMVAEHGTAVLLERLSDPFWFQALGCVLGFDWHSSGVTTTVCGALKEGLREAGLEAGFFVCGGKGGRSRATPDEIREHCLAIGLDGEGLVRSSRLSAKIDSAALQDGFQLYHHSFFFDRDGRWCVVQQGMADERDPLGLPHRGFARRYHWLGRRVTRWDNEPHAAICCNSRGQLTLNLVATASESTRKTAAVLAQQSPETTLADLRRVPELAMDRRHRILAQDIHPDRIGRILLKSYEQQPSTFLDLLALPNVGAKTLRALSLVSELVHGTAPSFTDPARFSFAHGGKDGTPYPVDRGAYDGTISALRELLNRSRVGFAEKRRAFERLGRFEWMSRAGSDAEQAGEQRDQDQHQDAAQAD